MSYCTPGARIKLVTAGRHAETFQSYQNGSTQQDIRVARSRVAKAQRMPCAMGSINRWAKHASGQGLAHLQQLHLHIVNNFT